MAGHLHVGGQVIAGYPGGGPAQVVVVVGQDAHLYVITGHFILSAGHVRAPRPVVLAGPANVEGGFISRPHQLQPCQFFERC